MDGKNPQYRSRHTNAGRHQHPGCASMPRPIGKDAWRGRPNELRHWSRCAHLTSAR
jgi:hypothetical protein